VVCRKVNQDMYAQIFKLLTERPVTAYDISEKVGMHVVNAQGLMRTFKRYGVVHVCNWRQDSMGRDVTPVYELGEGLDKPRRKKTAAQRTAKHREKLMSDKRFCTGCQVDRPKEGGIMKKTGKVNRWQCKMCQDKRSVSPYTKGEKHGEANFTSVV
jgi:hypothetical protein